MAPVINNGRQKCKQQIATNDGTRKLGSYSDARKLPPGTKRMESMEARNRKDKLYVTSSSLQGLARVQMFEANIFIYRANRRTRRLDLEGTKQD